MCLIAAVPAGKTLSMDVCTNAAQSNPDGWGMAWIRHGTVHVHKELHSLKRFMKRIRRACRSGSPVLVHFRFATHGSVGFANTHPFAVDAQTVVAHNGILHGFGQNKQADLSDTAEFVQTVLRKFPDAAQSSAGREWLGHIIGPGNKLAFLSASSGLSLVNEKQGIWDDGIWYSNGGYRERFWSTWKHSGAVQFPKYRYNRLTGWEDDPYDSDITEAAVEEYKVPGWLVQHSSVLCEGCLEENPELRDTAEPLTFSGTTQEYCELCGMPIGYDESEVVPEEDSWMDTFAGGCHE
jgi:hypothetical protein